MAKWELDEYEAVSVVARTSPSAKIHGVLTSVSPMKMRRTLAVPHRRLIDARLG